MRPSAFRAIALVALLFLGLGITPAPLVSSLPAASAQSPTPHKPSIALQHSVPAIVERALVLGRPDPRRLFPLLVSLNFARPSEVQTYADAISAPKSPLYRRFLTPAQIAARFGPSEADYAAVVAYLRANGLRIVALPVNRMTVRAEGTAAQIEAAFGARLQLYADSQTTGPLKME